MDSLSDILSKLYAGVTIQLDPFVYSATFATSGAANSLAAGAISTSNINIQADSDFIILAQSYDANTANAARTVSSAVVPNVRALLTDAGSGRNLYDNDVPVPAIFGNGQFPFILPFPKMLAAKSTLSVRVTNYDAAAGYNLFLHFHGVKVYKV